MAWVGKEVKGVTVEGNLRGSVRGSYLEEVVSKGINRLSYKLESNSITIQ